MRDLITLLVRTFHVMDLKGSVKNCAVASLPPGLVGPPVFFCWPETSGDLKFHVICCFFVYKKKVGNFKQVDFWGLES